MNSAKGRVGRFSTCSSIAADAAGASGNRSSSRVFRFMRAPTSLASPATWSHGRRILVVGGPGLRANFLASSVCRGPQTKENVRPTPPERSDQRTVPNCLSRLSTYRVQSGALAGEIGRSGFFADSSLGNSPGGGDREILDVCTLFICIRFISTSPNYRSLLTITSDRG